MSDKLLVSLENLGAGAAVERFDHELQKVLDNIADFNTEAKTVREVTLKLKIYPNNDRDYCRVEIVANSKVAPIRPQSTGVYIHNNGGIVNATEYNPKQEKINFEQKVTD